MKKIDTLCKKCHLNHNFVIKSVQKLIYQINLYETIRAYIRKDVSSRLM